MVALVSCVPGAGASFSVLAAIIVGGLGVATTLRGFGSLGGGGEGGGLAPLTPCMVACLPRGVGVRLSSLYVPQVAVVVHAEVHLGDTGCPNDLVGRFSCVGSV